MAERAIHFPEMKPTAGSLIRTTGASNGDKTLAVLGDLRLSYTEADERSAALARGLLASGAGKGTRVALLAPNGPDWITGWLGITRIGAVAVLLNTYSKARELSWLLRHSDAQVLLTVDRHLGHDYLERLEAAAPDLAGQSHEQILLPSHPYLRSVWTWGDGRQGWSAPVAELCDRAERFPESLLEQIEAEVTPADPMVVVYSSGSTADPKGAVHSHGAVVRHAHNLWPLRDITAADILYTPMPLFWVGGFSFTLVAAMHAGATLVFEEQFEPGATLELIERERVTQVLGWPHMAKALTDHPTFGDRDLSAVRGGTLAALLPGGLEPDPALRANSLGMTETLGPHTFDSKENELPPERAGSFGLSVPGVEHKVIDPVSGRDVPVGEVGELCVRGYSVMLGLHKREREDVFTPDGWYRTGDGGRFDEDGHFYFQGRLGDLIKSSGMNITPRDVEIVLEAMPEVTMAFVTGIAHAERGEDVVAAVALRPGDTLEPDEIRRRVKEEIASYKVPRHVAVFADQTQLPWLDSGKVDRRKLTALLEARFATGSSL